MIGPYFDDDKATDAGIICIWNTML
jgi:hypothetical protein